MTASDEKDRAKNIVEVRAQFRYRLLASTISAAIPSSMIGAVGELIRVGPTGYWDTFLQGAPISFVTALPGSLLVVPAVQRFVDRLFGIDPPA